MLFCVINYFLLIKVILNAQKIALKTFCWCCFYEFTKSRSWPACMLTCLQSWHPCVIPCFRTSLLCVLICLRAHVWCACLVTRLHAWRFRVLKCSRVWRACVLGMLTCLCAYGLGVLRVCVLCALSCSRPWRACMFTYVRFYLIHSLVIKK